MDAVDTFAKLRRMTGTRATFWLVTLLGSLIFAVHFSSWALAHLPVENSSELPPGLILPVRLEKTLDLSTLSVGTTIEARVAQTVPLSERAKIDVNSPVRGKVLSISKHSEGGVDLTLAFTQVEDRNQNLSLTTGVRAIASFAAVRAAQQPLNGADTGSPPGWANTIQIGGDIRYGDGGPVRTQKKQRVGKGVMGGVMVHIQANPARGCDGPPKGEDFLRATWVFSAGACGVYDIKELKIAHNGNSDPVGQITLHFDKADSKLENGTAFLLAVVEHP